MPTGMRRPRSHLAAGREPAPSQTVWGAGTVKTPFVDPARKTAPIA
jgi:hypothetical protein